MQLKVAGNTLGSLLCTFLKRVHEVQQSEISTGLHMRDVYNWIKVFISLFHFTCLASPITEQ